MRRVSSKERPGWRELAGEYGFHFHTMYGEPYWDESAYYQFSLRQIETEIEDPTAEIHQMCLQVVDKVVRDDELLRRFQIPEAYWDFIARSWDESEASLYSRLDLVYDGKHPAKLLENNADTPTSLYETGFWQWLWLENKIETSELPGSVDQFNSLQEKLIDRFAALRDDQPWHFACCKDTAEDRGTVQYLQDCAVQAGIVDRFVYIEDIGRGEDGWLTDQQNRTIDRLFKLYPWEFMLREEFAPLLPEAGVQFFEPPWKALISNKAILPLLWQMFPSHPNLLPAYFEDDPKAATLKDFVRKPLFAREGCNVGIFKDGDAMESTEGPYGEEGYIVQAYQPLPCFEGNYTLIGSWLIDDEPAGMSIREDAGPVTQDLSRFLPHVIL